MVVGSLGGKKYLRIQKLSKPFTNQSIPFEGIGDEKFPRKLMQLYKESYNRFTYGVKKNI